MEQITELAEWDIDAWDKIQAVRACTDSSCSNLVPGIQRHPQSHW